MTSRRSSRAPAVTPSLPPPKIRRVGPVIPDEDAAATSSSSTNAAPDNVVRMDPDNSAFPFAKYAGDNPLLPFPVQIREISVSDRDQANFNKLPEDARNACIGAVIRLMLCRATKNETVTRARISDTLKGVHSASGSCISVVLKEAKKSLLDTFGLLLVEGSQVPASGAEGSKFLYLVNTLRTPNFMRLLSDSLDFPELSFRGTLFVALHAIFAAPGRCLDLGSLVKRLKEVDRNIPDIAAQPAHKVPRKSTSDSESDGDEEDEDEERVIVDSQLRRADRASQRNQRLVKGLDEDSDYEEREVGASSSQLIKRKRLSMTGERLNLSNYTMTVSGDVDVKKAIDKMIKEAYLTKCKIDATDNETNIIVKYTFGPRFYAEIGLTRLILSYFDARGKDPNESIMKDIKAEEARLRAALGNRNDGGN